MSHRKTDLGILCRSKSAKVVLGFLGSSISAGPPSLTLLGRAVDRTRPAAFSWSPGFSFGRRPVPAGILHSTPLLAGPSRPAFFHLLFSTMRAPWRSSIKSSGYCARLSIGAAINQQVYGAGGHLIGATTVNGSSSIIASPPSTSFRCARKAYSGDELE
jgi:hypothetical protein